MDLSAQFLRDALHCIDLDGWNSDAGRLLLDHVRRAVVVPVVRRSGLRGPAADQAEASGWEAAWDALRRPTARTAENPGGMVWVAVRRAVAVELESARSLGGGGVDGTPNVAVRGLPARGTTAQEAPAQVAAPPAPTRRATRMALVPEPAVRGRCLSLEALMEGGWHPAQASHAAPDLGPVVAAVLDGLADAGWDRADAADAIEVMADHAQRGRTGSPTTRWRWVSLRLGVPEWQARRLAALLLGSEQGPGILELAARHGASVLEDPSVQAALRATTVRWAAGPGEWLAGFEGLSADRVIA